MKKNIYLFVIYTGKWDETHIDPYTDTTMTYHISKGEESIEITIRWCFVYSFLLLVLISAIKLSVKRIRTTFAPDTDHIS